MLKLLIKFLRSPFKFPRLTVYLGRISRGVPYFLPRNRLFEYKRVRLGFKTKWHETDYRFEWPPMISIVFLGLQFTVEITPPTEHWDSYWESWIYYDRHVDKTLPITEQVEKLREGFPLSFRRFGEGNINLDYYEYVLKPKYYTND